MLRKAALLLLCVLPAVCLAQDYGRGSSVGQHATLNAASGGTVNLAIDGANQLSSDGTSITVSKSVIPSADDSVDLGSSSVEWRNVYIDGALQTDALTMDGNITFSTTNPIIGASSAASLTIAGGALASVASGALVQVNGITSSGAEGTLALYSGDSNAANNKITFNTDAKNRITLEQDGDVQQDATNGGNLLWNKTNTSVAQSAATGLTAAGSSISDALQLAAVYNNVTTAAASTGVKLWNPVVGSEVVVRNGGANDLKLYPANASGTINGGLGGASITLTTAAKQVARCVYVATNTWFCGVATGS